ncbi:MAG: hypothetical protein R3A48_04410 [Polyangiales bacterium]
MRSSPRQPEHDGRPAMLLEDFGGAPLPIARGALTLDDRIRVALELGRAVAALHEGDHP